MDRGVQTHEIKANPTGYLWSKYEQFLTVGDHDVQKNGSFDHGKDVDEKDADGKQKKNQRTNGPVNAHLKPEIYTNKLV